MAVNLAGGCRVSEMREGEPFVAGTLRIWKQIGATTGAQAISLRVMEFGRGLSPGIRNGECDEILYVLDSFEARSECRLVLDGESFNVGGDTGIYIRPGETFAIDNPGPDSVIVISSQCPDPNSEPQFASLTNQSDGALNNAGRIVRLADRQPQSTADRWYRVLVDEEIGSLQVTQFVGSIPPGRAPDHFHQYEEVLFILAGEGRMWAGETSTPIGPGSCIFLPKGQVHCVENASGSELRLLGVFYPAGSPSVRYDV